MTSSAIFRSIPGFNVLIKTDAPVFTVVAVSNQFNDLLSAGQEEIIGHGIFKTVYAGKTITGPDWQPCLSESLEQVISQKQIEKIDAAQIGFFNGKDIAERSWLVINSPVIGDSGDVEFIVHSLEEAPVKNKKAQKSIERIERAYNLFMQTPTVISIVKGKEHIVELANQGALNLWDKNESILGTPLVKSIPEIKEQRIVELLDIVRDTGKPYIAKEVPVITIKDNRKVIHYFDLVYQPYFEEGNEKAAGVFSVSHDVTDLVLAKKELAESEQNLKLAVEIGGLGVFKVDLKTNRVVYSQQIMYWFDLDRQNELRPKMFLNIHADDQQRVANAVDNCLRGENSGKYDLTYRVNNQKLGKTFYLRSLGQVYFDNGIAQNISGIIQDVTEQKLSTQEIEQLVAIRTKELEAAQESLHQSNNYLQEVINIFNTPLQVLEPVFENGEIVDFRFKITNAAYAAYADSTPEKIQFKKVGELFPGYFQTSSFTKIVDTYNTGIADTWEIHYDVDGLDIYNMMSATRMGDEVIVHFYDFTKLKFLQLDLMKKIEELERSNKNLEEFAHAASHDLKEPIRKIQFFTEQLKDQLSDQLNSKEVDIFSRIENSSKRMGQLVDDLLQYSYVSHRPPQKKDVDLNEKIKQVLEDLELDIQQKSATIRVGILPVVQGFHRQLQQLFQNLISNALKYSSPDIIPEIEICAQLISENGRKYHMIEVNDNGIGFEPAYAEKIFQMFIRLHSKSEYSGTGVGLAIAKKVVENHGGIIRAESEPGVGTKFRVFLPV